MKNNKIKVSEETLVQGLDAMFADVLEITTEEYLFLFDKWEKYSENKLVLILTSLMSNDEKIKKKAKRLFLKIKKL